MTQPAWNPPASPEPNPLSVGPGVQEIAPYAPPTPPPADELQRFARAARREQWMRIPTERPLLTQLLLAGFVALYLLALVSEPISRYLYTYWPIQKFPIIDGQWWRLITGTFLHDNSSPLHLVVNGVSLYMVGMDVESFFGRARFATIYAISALGGSIASFIFLPRFSAGVGASGAIFGVFGALTVFYALNRHLFGRFGRLNFRTILIVLVGNLVFGLVLNASNIAPIDNSAHVGGLLAGAAVGFVLCPRYRVGAWRNFMVREIENTNKGRLPWIAAALIGLNVLAIFAAALLFFRQ